MWGLWREDRAQGTRNRCGQANQKERPKLFDRKQSKLWEDHKALHEEHQKLIRQWNKFVGEYNSAVAPRGLGRPLQASDAQVKDVRKLRKKGVSLRSIAGQTGLGLRTVRTIVEKDQGADRVSKRTNVLRKRELNRLRAADYRARNRGRDQLPKRINETLKRGQELTKAAKGLAGILTTCKSGRQVGDFQPLKLAPSRERRGFSSHRNYC